VAVLVGEVVEEGGGGGGGGATGSSAPEIGSEIPMNRNNMHRYSVHHGRSTATIVYIQDWC